MLKKNVKSILLISFVFSPNIGGVESHLDDLCDFLKKENHHVTVITYQPIISTGKGKYFERDKNSLIIRIPWFRFNLFNRLEKVPLLEFLYLAPPILFVSIIFLLLNRKKINVIQAHGFNMAVIGVFLSYLFQKSLTVNTHVLFYFQKKSIYAKILAFILNYATRVLVLTHDAKRQLEMIGVIGKKIVVYHQWIDDKLFMPKDKIKSRERLHLDKNKFIVFFAGRFVAAKGISLLMGAAKKINKNIQIVFVGSGPLKEKLIEASKHDGKILFIGQIKKNDLPYYYSAADVTIIPSVQATATYAEGIPRVLVESLSCGTPVIATKTGGVKELVVSSVGFFVSQTSNSITTMINDLYRKQKLLQDMSKHCVEFAKLQFSKKKNGRIIEKNL